MRQTEMNNNRNIHIDATYVSCNVQVYRYCQLKKTLSQPNGLKMLRVIGTCSL